MWFKNAQLFEFAEPFDLTAEQLAEAIRLFTFKPCSTHELKSMGWIAPMPVEGAELVYAADGCLMLCLRQEEKVIPASMVKEETQERIQAAEDKLGQKLRKRERDDIKEDVFNGLVTRALSKSAQTYAYIDMHKGWLVIDTSSPKKADDFIILLRRSLGSLPVRRPDVQSVPMLLTSWLRSNDYPSEFVIADSCKIKDLEEGGTINCSKQNLLADEILSLLDGPREISQMALAWQEQVAFQLNADFVVKSIRFMELVQDQANDRFTETVQDRFDADFVVMVGALREFLSSLLDVFGKGESVDTGLTVAKDAATEEVETEVDVVEAM